MENKMEKVWYASYGSNMLEARFLCYISGGRPEGAQRTYKGCTDKAVPKKNKPVSIKGELYFARSSKTWHNGGICFLNPKREREETLGRMYLISPQQFTELVKQESRYEGALNIDFQRAIKEGSLIIEIKSWYGRLLFLGFDEGHPIFTFTNEDFLEAEFNPPHESYLNMIKRGLKETYSLSEKEIQRYLKSKPGFEEHFEK